MTRSEAAARGEKTYQGKPCPRGHDGERYVTSGGCVHCGRAAALERYRRRQSDAKEAST